MVVHADEAGERRLTRAVEHSVTDRNRCVGSKDGADFRTIDQHGPILQRRRAGPVDDPQMRNCDLAGRHVDERLDVGTEIGWRRKDRRSQRRTSDREGGHRRE